MLSFFLLSRCICYRYNEYLMYNCENNINIWILLQFVLGLSWWTILNPCLPSRTMLWSSPWMLIRRSCLLAVIFVQCGSTLENCKLQLKLFSLCVPFLYPIFQCPHLVRTYYKAKPCKYLNETFAFSYYSIILSCAMPNARVGTFN